MGVSNTAIAPDELIAAVGTADCPVVFDVRRRAVFDEATTDIIPTARWRDAGAAIDRQDRDNIQGAVVVYCAHGHQLGQAAAASMRASGLDARYLKGGIEAYRAAGGPLVRKGVLPAAQTLPASRWITRERPKIDRIACPWFIRRFIDREAVIHFVEAEWVRAAAAELDAIPFDIPDVEFSHVGDLCSFDAFLDRFDVTDRALRQLAVIVRGADTAHLEIAPQAAGLLAMSLGLSAIYRDDHEMLAHGLVLYDALYAWCRYASAETHGWPPVTANKVAVPGEVAR